MEPDNSSPAKRDTFPAPLSPQELGRLMRSAQITAPDEPGEETAAFVSRVHERKRLEIERGGQWHYESRTGSAWPTIALGLSLLLCYAVGWYFTLHGLGVL